MNVREGPPQPAPPHREPTRQSDGRADPYPARKARGGEIVLNTPLRRWIFFGGLFGFVLLALALILFT